MSPYKGLSQTLLVRDTHIIANTPARWGCSAWWKARLSRCGMPPD